MEFYYSEISLHEIRKYKDLILKKSGMSKTEYEKILNKLLSYVILVPEEYSKSKLKEANKRIGSKDPDDVIFLAISLSLDNSIIWSNDRDFDKQNIIKVVKTKDMIKIL